MRHYGPFAGIYAAPVGPPVTDTFAHDQHLFTHFGYLRFRNIKNANYSTHIVSFIYVLLTFLHLNCCKNKHSSIFTQTIKEKNSVKSQNFRQKDYFTDK
jgi:hypothetical protein